jgi:hypothetical protein
MDLRETRKIKRTKVIPINAGVGSQRTPSSNRLSYFAIELVENTSLRPEDLVPFVEKSGSFTNFPREEIYVPPYHPPASRVPFVAREDLSRIHRGRCPGKMDTAKRIHRQGSPLGCEGWRYKSHVFGGEYLELIPHERLRYTDKFDDPNLAGVITVTITLKPVLGGTEMHIEQAGVPAVIPAEMCYLGWQESLILLAKLVEAEIPD